MKTRRQFLVGLAAALAAGHTNPGPIWIDELRLSEGISRYIPGGFPPPGNGDWTVDCWFTQSRKHWHHFAMTDGRVFIDGEEVEQREVPNELTDTVSGLRRSFA